MIADWLAGYADAIALVMALLAMAITGWLIWTLRANNEPTVKKRKRITIMLYVLIGIIAFTVLLLIFGSLREVLRMIL